MVVAAIITWGATADHFLKAGMSIAMIAFALYAAYTLWKRDYIKDFSIDVYIRNAFFSDDLCEDDWGQISGTTGRNTKVSGMAASGKAKMGGGWVAVVEKDEYLAAYSRSLRFRFP